MNAAVLLGYLIGGLLGFAAVRYASFGHVWPKIVRAQTLIGAVTLSIVAVWRITSLDSILWPFLLSLTPVLLFAVAWFTTHGPNKAARAAMHAWTGNANTVFWVVPIGAAIGGPAGVTAGVLMDRLSIPIYTLWVWLLRRGAPIPQRRRTGLIDQAPTIALGVGLLLHLAGPAPAWTATLTLVVAPILAASGAAIFVGSVTHHTQRIDPRPGLRTWLILVGVRIAYLIPVIVLAPTVALKGVGLLCALSIPAFAITQWAMVYGYRDPVVAAGSRFGWFVGAVGLVVAVPLLAGLGG